MSRLTRPRSNSKLALWPRGAHGWPVFRAERPVAIMSQRRHAGSLSDCEVRRGPQTRRTWSPVRCPQVRDRGPPPHRAPFRTKWRRYRLPTGLGAAPIPQAGRLGLAVLLQEVVAWAAARSGPLASTGSPVSTSRCAGQNQPRSWRGCACKGGKPGPGPRTTRVLAARSPTQRRHRVERYQEGRSQEPAACPTCSHCQA